MLAGNFQAIVFRADRIPPTTNRDRSVTPAGARKIRALLLCVLANSDKWRTRRSTAKTRLRLRANHPRFPPAADNAERNLAPADPARSQRWYCVHVRLRSAGT